MKVSDLHPHLTAATVPSRRHSFANPYIGAQPELPDSDDGWILVPSDHLGDLYWRFDVEITNRASGDPTQYRLIKLRNGMRVLLGNNKAVPAVGASVAFAAGMMDQPVCSQSQFCPREVQRIHAFKADIPGLAHLVEHCVCRSVSQSSGMDREQGFTAPDFSAVRASSHSTR